MYALYLKLFVIKSRNNAKTSCLSKGHTASVDIFTRHPIDKLFYNDGVKR
jgi:hypothetical protein